MKRWFYILLGGLGIGLAAAAAFLLWISPPLPPPYPMRVQIAEGILIAVGIVMGLIGFINGREAGELDISRALKAGRRDHHIAGHEIDFECPICHKAYRASPMLAGKPFTCRDCRQVFDVPSTSVSASSVPSPSVIQG